MRDDTCHALDEQHDVSCHAQLLQRDVQCGRRDDPCHAKSLSSVVENRMRDDSCHAQLLQRDIQCGIHDDSWNLKSLQFESENRKRVVSVCRIELVVKSQNSEDLFNPRNSLHEDHSHVVRDDVSAGIQVIGSHVYQMLVILVNDR